METHTLGHTEPDDASTRWVACEDCGHLEHPEFTCAQAANLVRAAALRELLSRIGPTLLAALDDAAEDRIERADSYCIDCVDAGGSRCDTHQGDLDQSAEYRRTYDTLHAALNA